MPCASLSLKSSVRLDASGRHRSPRAPPPRIARTAVSAAEPDACPSTSAAGAAASASTGEAQGDLQRFLAWAVANGVSGLGTDDAPVAIYSGEGGSRGLVAVRHIQSGQPVIRVPLRLALSDHEGEEENNRLAYEGAPWSVRLACRLLREVAKGSDSAWAPYLSVLPDLVRTPVSGFPWESIEQIEYKPLMQAMDFANWVTMDGFEQSSPEATGEATREQFEWALSLVHSRTFGTPDPRGGVAVRLMVPAIDMVNHACDEVPLMLRDDSRSADNVTWELLSPEKTGREGWEMELRSTQPIEKGAEVCLSYGARSNDEFLLHYGFVPERSTNDDVILFDDVTECLEWHAAHFAAGRSEEDLLPEYEAALAVGEEALELDAIPKHLLTEAVRADVSKLRITARGQATQPLIKCLAMVSGRDNSAAELAIALRCWQMLQEMTPLPCDLAWLAWHTELSQQQTGHWTALTSRYHTLIRSLEADVGQPLSGVTLEEQPSDLLQLVEGCLGAVDMPQPDSDGAMEQCLRYRAAKKMILWDVLIQIRPTPADLRIE